MSVVVRSENLSKRYRLGEINRGALYEDMQRFVARLRGRADTASALNQDGTPKVQDRKGYMWALRDFNMEVKDGDLVGIIGRNGAGKSTLLKILSRITAPTSGRAEIRGRLASLLEVGTGFHPELTGRENVYLNGTILGMKNAEIKRRFDEIVEFSGVEKFLDTPVKRYSSGMRVRLAFAVAAHLDPDILIVDEVLAVGDAAFQQKCIGKISSSAKEGRTILFVSHNAAAVENLCRRGIVLDEGGVVYEGSQTEALNYYAEHIATAHVPVGERRDRKGNGAMVVSDIALRNPDGTKAGILSSGRDYDMVFRYHHTDEREFRGVILEMVVSTMHETPLFMQSTKLAGTTLDPLPRSGEIVCRIPRFPLTSSAYKISYRLLGNHGYLIIDAVDSAVEFHVEGGDFFGSGNLPPAHRGAFLVGADWRVDTLTK